LVTGDRNDLDRTAAAFEAEQSYIDIIADIEKDSSDNPHIVMEKSILRRLY